MESINSQLVLNPPRSGDLENSPKTLELSPRQKAITSLAEMARKLKGLPAMERAERAVTVRSWEMALAEIPDADLEPTFQRAARNYTDVSKPFGVPQLLDAYDRLRNERAESRRRRQLDADRQSARNNAADQHACPHCRDKRAQWVRLGDGYLAAKLCECSGGSRALRREDGWMQNEKGEWYHPSWQQPGDEYCNSCGVLKDHGRCEQCDNLL